LPYDQLDSLIISQIKTLGNGTAGTGAGTAGPDSSLYYDQTSTGLGNNGYGVLNGNTPPVETAGDGTPDYWKLALGSNTNVADSLAPGTGGYTKLENYLNWLAAPHAVTQTNVFVNVNLTQYTGGFTNASPVYSVFAPTNGTVALLADGHTAQFAPAGNFSGLGSFNFSVLANDSSAMTNTVTICVTPNAAGLINFIVTRPQFNAINAGAGGLVMSGSGGLVSGNYYVLGSTNIALPLNSWPRLATNQFDNYGNFNFTNAMNTNSPQNFMILQIP
jgi:hypothetical protein